MALGISSSESPWGAPRTFSARARNLRAESALSLLPKAAPVSQGKGLGSDVYEAVAKQSQGLYSGGRTAAYSAKAILGIDMSQSFKHRQLEGGAAAEKTGNPDPEPAKPTEPAEPSNPA